MTNIDNIMISLKPMLKPNLMTWGIFERSYIPIHTKQKNMSLYVMYHTTAVSMTSAKCTRLASWFICPSLESDSEFWSKNKMTSQQEDNALRGKL